MVHWKGICGTKISNCPDDAPEKMLAVKQTRFSLPDIGYRKDSYGT
ncbi:MAG: hypothetical protein HDQ96_03310 [Lachnospiraceae bacterium]|nr:hypothetical protein [Lachnospiraceae bacterium]